MAALEPHGTSVHAKSRHHGRRRLLVVSRSSGGGGRGGRGGRHPGGGRDPPKKFTDVEWRGPGSLRQYKASDGLEHLGSALTAEKPRPFPGPPPDEGPPLRVLPVGGLGEIGMNCMLVGVKDRYIVIDAGLMFPDFTDLGMQKILPDTSFLHEWKDKIEALVITHGHEDHIGALPWVVPALDPSTPIYATSFVMQLIKRRLTEYNLYDEARFRTFEMRKPFEAGPFQVEGIRVTHSIPDCCGLIMRSDEGTIVHTGDWKIDETPIDGQEFDRSTFDLLSKEKVALFMSDSTNVLAPGRTQSEAVVHDSIVQKVLAHNNKGRVIITQFASNLARLYGVKAAADASGRKICFVGASLNHYLEAAWQDGRAPFDPNELIPAEHMKQYDPSKILVVSTGSQGEPNAQLSKAAREAAKDLKIRDGDLILYSAKVIPGNEPQVSKMMNSLTMQGARVMQGRGDNLHTSGHAYQEELKEVMRLVKPQHFLPVHGEYSFLTEHARLAREEAGVSHVSVIKNGQMLGVHERSSRSVVSSGSMAEATMSVIGRAALVNYYNDGGKGTGSKAEMAITERTTIALDGVVVVGVDVRRNRGSGLEGTVRITTRAMWTDNGRLRDMLHESVTEMLTRLPPHATLPTIERAVVDNVRRTSYTFNFRKPEVICICHENDPRDGRSSRIYEQRQQNTASSSTMPGARPLADQAPVRTPRPWEQRTQASSRQQPAAAAAASDNSSGSDDDIEIIDDSREESPPRRSMPITSQRQMELTMQQSKPGEDHAAAGVSKPQRRPSTEEASTGSSRLGKAEAVDEQIGMTEERLVITRLGSDGEDSPPEEEPVAASTTGTKAMLASRRKAAAASTTEAAQPDAAPKKRGRKSKSASAAPTPGELKIVPERIMRARRAANPRDNPQPGADPDSLAYD